MLRNANHTAHKTIYHIIPHKKIHRRGNYHTLFIWQNKNKVVILLKGYNTIITDGEYVYINNTGNSKMASGGMGTGVMQNAFAAQPQPQQQYDPYAQAPQQQPAETVQAAPTGVKCTNCGATVNGKFCSECGTPVATGPKKCSKCGAEVTGKFCSECGTPAA